METPPLTMRGALVELEVIQDSIEWIINSMNSGDAGGFERHMYDLRHHAADAKELLKARMYGQLTATQVEAWADPHGIRVYDKPLSRC